MKPRLQHSYIDCITRIRLWILLLPVAACLFQACHSGMDYSEIGGGESEGAWFKLTLSLPVASTRAVPQGGEGGDGEEEGVRGENRIDNVWIYIFRADDWNAADDTPILYSRYFSSGCEEWTSLTDGVQITFRLQEYVPRQNDCVIAVANAGAESDSPATLGALRNLTSYKAWMGNNVKDCYHFVMSSAYDEAGQGRVETDSRTGTKSDPYISEMKINRLAARIDFMYNRTDNLKDGNRRELVYEVKEDKANGEKLATLHLQHIIPVNLMQRPSYMIRRVTTGSELTSTVTYGGKEQTDATTKEPVNYVIEPHTIAKNGTVSDEQLTAWYGNTRASVVYANPAGYIATSGIEGYLATEEEKNMGDPFTHIMTLAYTQENTQDKSLHLPRFMTGLLLRAVYEPAKVYADAGCETTVPDFAAGTTFWRYSPTKAVMKEDDCLYFSNEAAALAYKQAHPADLAEITEYADGVCYYGVWLRHANVDSAPHLTFPMEYGIVRNNIYRLGVEKFTGPGTPVPDLKAPDKVHLRIFVRPWNRREQPVIRL